MLVESPACKLQAYHADIDYEIIVLLHPGSCSYGREGWLPLLFVDVRHIPVACGHYCCGYYCVVLLCCQVMVGGLVI